VAAELSDKCEVQITYIVGVTQPVYILVNTLGTGKIIEDEIVELIKKYFYLRLKAIISHLKRLRSVYEKTADYGHFGRDDYDFIWENIDISESLRTEAGL